MASVTKETIGNLHDKITVKVSKEDYYPAFEKAIKDYSKKANVPGFRKGMVPAGMVKKMYGASIYYDEVIRTVEKELQKYLVEEKPEIFAQPLPMENDLRGLNMNEPADYEFPFEIGLKPEVSIANLESASTVMHKIAITDEMVATEIENQLAKNGTLKDVEEVASPDTVLNVVFTEADASGAPIEGAEGKDNSILVKYFSEALQNELQGKKVGDVLLVQLKTAFGDKEREWILSDLGLDKNNPADVEKFFNMAISKIGLVEKKELNEEFFNLIFPGKEIKTEEEFKAALQEEMQKQWDAASMNQLHDQIYHILLDTPMELPQDFLKRWLEIGGEKQKTKQEVENEFPTFLNQLKWTLISDKVITENNLEVSEEEIREALKAQIMGYFGQMNLGDDSNEWVGSYIDRMMSDEKQVDATYRKLVTEKLFQHLATLVTPSEKIVTPEEFGALQHDHKH